MKHSYKEKRSQLRHESEELEQFRKPYHRAHDFVIKTYVEMMLGLVERKLEHFGFLFDSDKVRFANNPSGLAEREIFAAGIRDECLKFVESSQHHEGATSVSTEMVLTFGGPDERPKHLTVTVGFNFDHPSLYLDGRDVHLELGSKMYPFLKVSQFYEVLEKLSADLAECFVNVPELLEGNDPKLESPKKSLTFEVDNVSPEINSLDTLTIDSVIEDRLDVEPESFSERDLIDMSTYRASPSGVSNNAFVSAVHYSFDNHLPLSLSPDVVWNVIAQGFAEHVQQNPEDLRSHFVDHEGEETIRIVRNEFVKGSPDNDWLSVFGEYSDEIAGFIGEKQRQMLLCEFSTTTPSDLAASQITMMGAMSEYFEYIFKTMCGFPSITLEGTQQDWEKILQKTQALEEYDLKWWTQHLCPLLENIVETFDGNPDRDFWRSLYKTGGGSGGPYVSGWINSFFPYLKDFQGCRKRNPYVDWTNSEPVMGGGPTPDQFPSSLVSVDFVWEYYSQEIDMQFVGGIVGSEVNDNMTVRPTTGWAVAEQKK